MPASQAGPDSKGNGMKLDNRIALVTGVGAQQGLGKAIADCFAAEGARLAIADIDEQAVMARAAELRARGVDCVGIRCDVSSVDSVRRMFEKVLERFGTLDILVNNAARVPVSPADTERRNRFYRYQTTPVPRQSLGITSSLTDDDWLRWWGVNVHGVFWCIREALRIMEPKRYGRIVNIASVSGISKESAHSPGYSATKAAVVSLTRTVAADVAGANIFVNAIAPGGVRTDQFDAYLESVGPDAVNALYQLVPAGRLGEGREYGALAVHLASDETYCVGQVISPNGGLVI
jgi:3-oxoacyl-[acyl-carrier protein] reductase